MLIKSAVAFFSLLFLSSRLAFTEELAWTPNAQSISEIEQILELPSKDAKLEEYVRHYWGTMENGVAILNGQFHLPWGDEEKPNTIHINDPDGPPMIFDGGCSVVNLRWNMRLKKLIAIWCNGVA